MKIKARNRYERAKKKKAPEDKAPDIRVTGNAPISHEDREFVVLGDNGFDPERNKKIIEEVALNNWKNREKKRKEFADKLEERADAVATFWKSDKVGNERITPMLIKRYFGKKELFNLRSANSDHVDFDNLFSKPSFVVNGTKKEKSKKKSSHKANIKGAV